MPAREEVAVVELSPGPAFSVSYCGSPGQELAQGLLAVAVNTQSSLASPHSWASGAASLMVYCVVFVWPWAGRLNTKVGKSGDVKTSVADVSDGEK